MKPETELELSLNHKEWILRFQTFSLHIILVVKVYLSFWSDNSPETVEEGSIPNPIPPQQQKCLCRSLQYWCCWFSTNNSMHSTCTGRQKMNVK